ncbi:MAG: hypothetical protein KME27_00020 [Lyngbya sp. HA4199-MV5]|jgi:hypothetical protein|nr:hypothetical protein [Lyngbya sp. HA4199-MV5]
MPPDGNDHYLQMRLASGFMHTIATETLDMHPDQLELLPTFRTRDPQIEAIGLQSIDVPPLSIRVAITCRTSQTTAEATRLQCLYDVAVESDRPLHRVESGSIKFTALLGFNVGLLFSILLAQTC